MTDLGADGDSPPTPAENDGTPVATAPDPDGAHPGVAGKTILVVDDDDQVRQSMADILSSEGCMVVTTDSGTEALRYLSRSPVDLIVSDVMMPDMDGYELFQELQTQYGDVPVVLMTAYYYDKDHVIKRSRAEGLEDVIYKKPIDPERLLELVEARVGG